MRRFELSDGSSNKFWEIATSGASVTVTFGRIGTAGQTKTKDLGSAAAAALEEKKLVREKVGKGYVEVTSPTAAAHATAAPHAPPVSLAPQAPESEGPEIEATLQALADIKEWFVDQGAMSVVDNLQPGATEQALAAVEARLGHPLPPELKAVYRIHDGQREIELGNQLFAYGIGAFLSVEHAWEMTSSDLVRFITFDDDRPFARIPPSPEQQFPPSSFEVSRYGSEPTVLRPEECSTAWWMFAWQETFAGWLNLRSGRVFGWAKDEGLALEAENFGAFLTKYADDLWKDKHALVCGDESEPAEARSWHWKD